MSLAIFLTLLTLTAALPSPVALPAPQSSFVPTSTQYYLKTTSKTPAFSDLYLSAYHTGAGFNDAVLIPTTSTTGYNTSTFPGIVGFLNVTSQEFSLGGDFPWGMVMNPSITYDAWLPVQINAGFGSSGFYFNNTDGTGVNGLKWVDGWPSELAGTKYNDFAGWLACNWAHGLPQLFWLAAEEPSSAVTLPCNCAKVELIRQFL
ncbi:hypothetical protein MMC34_000881 [Xylographa carneopallida]|nr:hypothetical protein [Xylographa carneopallida]